jgi:hypothetical protein
MKRIFFKTLIATASVSSFSIALFTTLVMIFYKSPLYSVPKDFDWLFFVGFPVWAMLYYKLKVNQKKLDFQEGLVMGALVSFAMFVSLALVIWIATLVNEQIMINYSQDWIKDLTDNKTMWLSRVKTEQDYNNMLLAYQKITIGQYLFREFGLKTIILLFVSWVGATAFRGEPQPIKKSKK